MTAPTPRRTIWVQLLLYPTHTLPTALAPVLVAVGLAIRHDVFAPLPALVAFVGSWLIHVGGVFADNHELLRRHPDVIEHPELQQALASRTLDLRTLRRATLACFALGVAPAPYLLAIGGWPVLTIGMVGVVASLGYAAGPWPYARVGIAAPVFFAMFGVVAVVGTWFVQAAAVGSGADWAHVLPQRVPPDVWIAGLPVGALITGVLWIDDIRDRGFDAVKGWNTDVVRHGLGVARGLFVAAIGFAYLFPLVLLLFGVVGPGVLACWLTAPVSIGIVRAVLAHDSTAALRFATPRLSVVSAGFALLYGAGLAWA